jgi:nitrogen fixation NifU-like protein
MDLDELYQTIILDHARRPRNHGELPDADACVHADNPSCGDELTLYVKFAPDGEVLEEVKFTGQGCAISQASASLMTTRIRGKSSSEAEKLREIFQELVTSPAEPDPAAFPPPELGDAGLLQGVRRFPQRVKCATLAWNALKQALEEHRHHPHHHGHGHGSEAKEGGRATRPG